MLWIIFSHFLSSVGQWRGHIALTETSHCCHARLGVQSLTYQAQSAYFVYILFVYIIVCVDVCLVVFIVCFLLCSFLLQYFDTVGWVF